VKNMMRNKKALAIASAVVLVVALLASGVIASPPINANGPPPPVESKINYQGQLADSAGNALDGTYNMEFLFYDSASGGSQVGSTITRSDVQVADGLFSVKLDVDQSDFNGQALWLEVRVEGEELTPRQQILPTPYALSLKPGADINGTVSGAILHAENAASNGYGLRGDAIATSGPNYGVAGKSTSSAGYGGYFYNNASGGTALYARAAGTMDADLVLGGTSSGSDEGCIYSDPTYSGSDIWLISYDEVLIRLDNDDNEQGHFVIRNGADHEVFNVDEDGDAHVTGDLTAGDANTSLPIAYAFINPSGAVASGTSNVSSAWSATSHCYEITITGEDYSWIYYVTIVTPTGGGPRIATTGSVGGKLLVYIFDSAGNRIQNYFQFVTYKP